MKILYKTQAILYKKDLREITLAQKGHCKQIQEWKFLLLIVNLNELYQKLF